MHRFVQHPAAPLQHRTPSVSLFSWLARTGAGLPLCRSSPWRAKTIERSCDDGLDRLDGGRSGNWAGEHYPLKSLEGWVQSLAGEDYGWKFTPHQVGNERTGAVRLQTDGPGNMGGWVSVKGRDSQGTARGLQEFPSARHLDDMGHPANTTGDADPLPVCPANRLSAAEHGAVASHRAESIGSTALSVLDPLGGWPPDLPRSVVEGANASSSTIRVDDPRYHGVLMCEESARSRHLARSLWDAVLPSRGGGLDR